MRVQAGGDHARDVGDVGHEVRADLIGDRTEPREVDEPAVGTGAGDYQLGPELERDAPHGVVVEDLAVRVDRVAGDLVVDTGEVHPVSYTHLTLPTIYSV